MRTETIANQKRATNPYSGHEGTSRESPLGSFLLTIPARHLNCVSFLMHDQKKLKTRQELKPVSPKSTAAKMGIRMRNPEAYQSWEA